MHIKYLKYLACPETGRPLVLGTITHRNGDNIIEGSLLSGEREYKVLDGIPRFVPSTNYAASFGFQWNRWPKVQFESENQGKPMSGHTAKMFNRILGPASSSDLSGKTILDLGCGPGRFVELARKRGASVIAIDYSLAVDTVAENFNGDEGVCVIQGDALCLPIVSGVVDGAYSIGVLHHTPDPARGFAEMVRVLCPGAWAALCLYGQGGHYDRQEVNIWRSVFRLLMPYFGVYPALVYAYFGAYIVYPLSFIPVIGHILRLVYPTVRLPDIKWRILDTFDSVTPCHQSRHTPYEMYQWFESAGLINIQPTNWGVAAMYGGKPA